MKYLIVLFVGFFSFLQLVSAQETVPFLYPIIQDDKFGYINEQGTVVIKPKFQSASKFQEGLAVVGQKGMYGFINSKGKFIIKAKYDYAEAFEEGIAKVYLNGKAYFINKKGKLLFEHDFDDFDCYPEYGIAIAKKDRYYDDRYRCYGLVDMEGKLILDTMYSFIRPFKNGVSVVKSKSGDLPRVINIEGQFITPIKAYSTIEEFQNGYAKVLFASKKGEERKWGND